MIRSNRSIRRLCTLVVAMLACALALPAIASAQSIDPTDEQYREGVLGVAAAGGGDDGAGDPSGSGSSSGSGAGTVAGLPFTGLDLAAIVAIGAGLVGAGFAVRRVARVSDARLS